MQGATLQRPLITPEVVKQSKQMMLRENGERLRRACVEMIELIDRGDYEYISEKPCEPLERSAVGEQFAWMRTLEDQRKRLIQHFAIQTGRRRNA